MSEISAEAGSCLMVQCPSCHKRFKSRDINVHVNKCLDRDNYGVDDVIVVENGNTATGSKKRKSTETTINSSSGVKTGWGFLMSKSSNDKVNLSKTKRLKTSPFKATDDISPSPVNKDNSRSDDALSIQVVPTPSSTSRTEIDKQVENGGISSITNTGELDLFDLTQPLAEQMRPLDLDSYKGQDGAVGDNTLLRSLLQRDTIPSMILWGPPGCGKTTLARIVANKCKSKIKFVQLSATSSGVADVKEMIKNAKNNFKTFKKRTILFLDEIHRFNKTQQDTLLPHVEDGTITLIGATTENPSFQVNTALLSRCRVIVLQKLDSKSIQAILGRAVDRLGFQVYDGDEPPHTDNCVFVEKQALETLSLLCDGDARVALNGFQMTAQAVMAKHNQSQNTLQTGPVVVTVADVKQGLQRTHVAYDKTGEEHYNCASAIQKSMRGSDASAALYWLARMLEGGETPLYVARRLVSFASEDIGVADNQALTLAVSTYQACHFLGMPECEKVLAQCVVYLARAPKSVEVYEAYNRAKNCVKQHQGPLPGVPLHLRNASTRLMKDLGYGKGYKYNPAFREPVQQQYFPEELVGTNFFK